MSVAVKQVDLDAAEKWLDAWDAFSAISCKADLARAFAEHRMTGDGLDYKTGWESLSEPLAWMHESKQLGAYWGWNLADIANDLIDRAYPDLRAKVSGHD